MLREIRQAQKDNLRARFHGVTHTHTGQNRGVSPGRGEQKVVVKEYEGSVVGDNFYTGPTAAVD